MVDMEDSLALVNIGFVKESKALGFLMHDSIR